MVFLDQTWRVYKSKTLTFISITFFDIYFYNLWISLNIFLNFFFFFFLCQKLSEFSGFQTLFFHRKQKCAISFHSLLPLPKRIQQGLIAWILFVSLFSLFQKNKGLTAWILFVSPFSLVKEFKTTQSENSSDSSLSFIQKCSKD